MRRSVAAGAGALILALLLPLFLSPYGTHIGTMAWYYGILAVSWALLAGYAGQFSFGHMGFAALGGYTSGLLMYHLNWPMAITIPAGLLVAAAMGGVIGWICLRLRGPYLALFTLAFSEILRIILLTEKDFTRGSLGLHTTLLYPGEGKIPFYYTALGLLLVTIGLLSWLVRSRWGLFFRAIREEEDAAAASGVHVVRYKVLAFVISSAFAGLAGTFYTHYVGILTPNIIEIEQMGLIIAMAVIGGLESLVAALGGAVVVETAQELLREYGQWRWVLFGAMLLLTMRFARNGLLTPLLAWFARRPTPCAGAPVSPRMAAPRAASNPAPPAGGSYRGEALVHGVGLVKRFGGIVAVDHISIDIGAGELVGLIGPNGSGKTTLINLMAGAYTPDQGRILLGGREMQGHAAYDFAAAGVGRTFQISQLFRRMTVIENMQVPGLTRHDLSVRDVDEKADDILSFLGLIHLRHDPAKTLSGGQLKLLELGRALMLDPAILFLDEPFAGVNPALRGEIVKRLVEINGRGHTLVVVDHVMEAIQQISRRLVVMARGQIIADGPPEEVRRDRAVLAAYSGGAEA